MQAKKDIVQLLDEFGERTASVLPRTKNYYASASLKAQDTK